MQRCRIRKALGAWLLAVLPGLAAHADVRLPSVLSDHLVLQRLALDSGPALGQGMLLRIWGGRLQVKR
jgi:hypothetical protein